MSTSRGHAVLAVDRQTVYGVALLIGALAVVGGGSPVQAASTTYYVSVSGNDSNPGTETQPFRTVQRAANVINAGDTVIVENGTYTGTGVGTACASSTVRPVVCLSRGGTSSAWVTFRARNPLAARIDGQANTSTHGFYFLSDANYIRIEGFDVFGMGNPTKGSAGFLIYSGGHDVVIAHNAIHDIGRLCTDHIYGMSGVYIQNARVTVEGNRIYDIGRFAAGESGCSPTTTNYQNHDHGLYINGGNDGDAPGARDIRVSNNRFSNLQRGWPIQVYPAPVANLSILHNTFARGNPYRVGHIILAASTTDARIINNIFFDPTTAAINFNAGTHTNLTVRNNLTSKVLASGAPSGVTFASNMERTDPQLAVMDFRPFTLSPAIDQGMPLSEVTTDIEGTPRPNGAAPDIGAYELGRPSPPKDVRITRQ
jgi:hypothetical protein